MKEKAQKSHLFAVSSDVRASDESLLVDACLSLEGFDDRFQRQNCWLSGWRWRNVFQHRNGLNATTVFYDAKESRESITFHFAIFSDTDVYDRTNILFSHSSLFNNNKLFIDVLTGDS